jgi:hypothetical protein
MAASGGQNDSLASDDYLVSVGCLGITAVTSGLGHQQIGHGEPSERHLRELAQCTNKRARYPRPKTHSIGDRSRIAVPGHLLEDEATLLGPA